MRLFVLVAALLLCASTVVAQSAIGLKFFGLSIHPNGDPNAFLMPRKLDAGGVLVVNLGGMASYEKYIGKDFSVKAVQALYADCASRAGGFTHLGLRARIFTTGRHSLSGGLGPTLVFRRNWQDLKGYINPGYFKGGPDETWQYKFLWYGGEFEYALAVNDKLDLSTTFVPGYPKLMSLSFGIRVKAGR